MFVDWAGATIPVYDATTGRASPASLVVSVLGASSHTCPEATRYQQLEAWIQAHIHALEFFGGVQETLGRWMLVRFPVSQYLPTLNVGEDGQRIR